MKILFKEGPWEIKDTSNHKGVYLFSIYHNQNWIASCGSLEKAIDMLPETLTSEAKKRVIQKRARRMELMEKGLTHEEACLIVKNEFPKSHESA